MSADWKAGDKALCVKPFVGIRAITGERYDGPYPVVDVIYLVTLTDDSWGILALGIVGFDDIWVHDHFRKIVPACDRVTVEVEQEAAQ